MLWSPHSGAVIKRGVIPQLQTKVPLCKNSVKGVGLFLHDVSAQQRSPAGRPARVVVRVSASSAVRASVDSVVRFFAAARAEAGATAAGVWPSVGLAARAFEKHDAIPREGAVADAAGAV